MPRLIAEYKYEEEGAIVYLYVIPLNCKIGFTMLLNDIIDCIESNDYYFYTKNEEGLRIPILVVNTRRGKHLRSKRNNEDEDNLDTLPLYEPNY